MDTAQQHVVGQLKIANRCLDMGRRTIEQALKNAYAADMDIPFGVNTDAIALAKQFTDEAIKAVNGVVEDLGHKD